MSDEQDDALRHLRAELSALRPSPGFAESVRARIAEESSSRSWSLSWPSLAMVTAAAVVVVAWLVTWPAGGRRDRPAEQTIAHSVTAPGEAPAVSAQAAPVTSSAPLASPGDSRRPAPRSVVSPARVAAPTPAPREPQLEVITNQGDVLRALWARVRGPVTESAAPAADSSRSGESSGEITVAPISLEPIVVRAIDAPAPGGSGTPAIRRVADDATRSER